MGTTLMPEAEECVPGEGKYEQKLITDLGWLPLTSLIIYVFFFAIGTYVLQS